MYMGMSLYMAYLVGGKEEWLQCTSRCGLLSTLQPDGTLAVRPPADLVSPAPRELLRRQGAVGVLVSTLYTDIPQKRS